jgi:hypothetical protein
MVVKKILVAIMKTKIRVDRGLALISYVKYFIYALGLKFAVSNQWSVFLLTALVTGLLAYSLGLVDQKYGIWKIENLYLTREINPYFKKLETTINHKKR